MINYSELTDRKLKELRGEINLKIKDARKKKNKSAEKKLLAEKAEILAELEKRMKARL